MTETRRPGECVDCAALLFKPVDLVPGEEQLYGPEFRPTKPRPTDGAPRKPRCTTHRRVERKRVKAARHDTYVSATYGVSPGFYAKMLAAQSGRCAICQRATGKTRRLAVDHDHRLAREHDHPEDRACADCVRGLLCSTCNRVVIGRYGTDALRRAIGYLDDPPAQQLLVSMDETA